MIPTKTIEELILKHSILEKDLSSGDLGNKLFAEKSKEYSDVSEVIVNAKKYLSYEKDKKELENLSEQELAELKDSIDEAIENKKYKKSYANTNTKGIAIAWIVVAVLISLYRYFSM